MRRCFFTPEANQDLEEIHDFIAGDSPKRALDFIEHIEENVQLLAKSPEIGRRREELIPGIRSFPVGHHIVFYRILKSSLEVLRILHGSRDIPNIFTEEQI